MAYEFTKLSEVNIIEKLTENAHLIVEDGGKTRRFLASQISGKGEEKIFFRYEVDEDEDRGPFARVHTDDEEKVLQAVKNMQSLYTFIGKTNENYGNTRVTFCKATYYIGYSPMSSCGDIMDGYYIKLRCVPYSMEDFGENYLESVTFTITENEFNEILDAWKGTVGFEYQDVLESIYE